MARVLVVTNLYPPHAYGGYELSCRDVVTRWRAGGHDVAVLTSDHRSATAIGGADEPDVERALPLTSVHGAPPPLWRRPWVERAAHRRLADAVRRHRPDVISVWNMAGLPLSLLAAAVAARPSVLVLADSWPVHAPAGDPWLAPLASRPRLRAAVAAVTRAPTQLPDATALGPVCFCSAWLRDAVLAEGPWRSLDARVVHLGIDPRDFPIDEAASVGPWSGRLLFVGRLDATKGIDTLVRALPQLPASTTLDVVAPLEPGHLERLKGLTHTLGLDGRVQFDAVPRADLAARYRAADVFVFPSEWDEPFGLVPLEAMASGTPVVATGTGGSAEYLVDGQNALLFPPGDADALAAAIQRLAGDDELRAALAAGGTATAPRFTSDRLAAELEAIHLEAAQSRSVR